MKHKLQLLHSRPRSQWHRQARGRSDSKLQRLIAAGHRHAWTKRTTLLTIKCHSLVPRRLEVRVRTCGTLSWVQQASVTATNLNWSHSLELQCQGPKNQFRVIGRGTTWWRLLQWATLFNSKVSPKKSASILFRNSSVWLRKKMRSWLTRCTGQSLNSKTKKSWNVTWTTSLRSKVQHRVTMKLTKTIKLSPTNLIKRG